MANFSASVLAKAQTLFNDMAVNSAEFRLPDTAAINVAKISGMHNPSIESVKKSTSRTVEAYFPIRQAATNGTARAALHTGARGDSLASSYSWSTFAETFSISMNQAQSNVMLWAEMYAYSRLNAILNILNRVDAWMITSLLADKTGYCVDGANGTFNGTADVYEVPNTEKDYFFSETKTMMTNNLYGGALVGILDSKAATIASKVSNQGAGNSTNLSYTVNGYTGLVQSTRTIVSGYEGSGIFFDPSTVSVIPWVQEDYRRVIDVEKAWNGNNGDRGQFTLPELPGFTFMEKIYTTQSDASSSGGTVDDIKMEVQISVDVAYGAAPISTFRGADDSSVFISAILS